MRRRRPKHEFAEPHRAGRYWWACEHPERPFDPWVCWLWECDFCLAAAMTEAKYHPHLLMVTVCDDPGNNTDLDGAIAEALRWREEQGLEP